MSAQRRRMGGAAMGILLLCLAACATPVEPASVKGRITYRGYVGLIPGIKVWPQDRPGARPFEAACDAKGEFSFTCPPGRYKLCPLAPLSADGQPDLTFPAAYLDPDQTPLPPLDVPPTGIEGYRIDINE